MAKGVYEGVCHDRVSRDRVCRDRVCIKGCVVIESVYLWLPPIRPDTVASRRNLLSQFQQLHPLPAVLPLCFVLQIGPTQPDGRENG